MIEFFTTHTTELITSAIVIIFFGVINFLSDFLIKKIGSRGQLMEARSRLISRYITITLILILLLIEAFIFGARWQDIGIVFSSVFAVIGIALFAIWSILSNVTSGVIMFFSFPYKVGDKIEIIHEKEFYITGIIEDIRAFHLHLRKDNGDLITYPNNLILQKAVTLIKKDAIEDLDEISI